MTDDFNLPAWIVNNSSIIGLIILGLALIIIGRWFPRLLEVALYLIAIPIPFKVIGVLENGDMSAAWGHAVGLVGIASMFLFIVKLKASLGTIDPKFSAVLIYILAVYVPFAFSLIYLIATTGRPDCVEGFEDPLDPLFAPTSPFCRLATVT